MASRRRTTATAHEWTEFEKHTLLCLMAKGMHLEERGNRQDEPGAMRRHAYLNVATELNKAVNGANDFGNDIDKKEVAKMIDRMMIEKKGVVGKGGYMERATSGRVTRGLKRMWNREPSIDYDGSQTEWKQWRKESEAEKRRIAAGGVPKDPATEGVVESVENDAVPDIVGDIWRQAGLGHNRPGINQPSITRTPAIPLAPLARPLLSVSKPHAAAVAIQESFNRLPASLRGNEKYAWANPATVTSHRSSHASHSSNIDSHRPSGGSSRSDPQPNQSSNRLKPPMMDSYRPATNPQAEESRPPSYQLHSSNINYGPSTRNERSSQLQDIPRSTPSLTNDYSSSPSKHSTYSGTAQPTNKPYTDAHLTQTIQYEISQRRSSDYKKPGILKHRPVNEQGDRPADKFNPERLAMLVQPDVEMEMGEIREGVSSASRGSLGKGVNNENLPFNRLERRGY